MKKIETEVIKEILKSNINGSIPILVDVKNDKIKWSSTETQQENRHFRLVSDVKGVNYKGVYYAPAAIGYTPPTEDGSTISGASIKISCLDKRAVELIRSIKEPLEIEVIAMFSKQGDEVYFRELTNHVSWITSATWNRLVATFPLTFDRTMDLQVPRDTANLTRLPSNSTES